LILPRRLLESGARTTRFAPSTTGYLHLGHALHAIYVWGVARAVGARVFLRIEDHDRSRHRPEFETAILDDLYWLGFEPDPWEGHRMLVQRDRTARYAALASDLRARELAYGCDCSRSTILARTGAGGGELRYDGHCRHRGLPLGEGLTWRMVLPDEEITFDDLHLGPQRQRPASQCGDPAIRDRRNNWTYQFAVVADDWDQGVDLVIRGEDLLDSTGRQLLMAQALGRTTPPAWLHHPLLPDTNTGLKLSKRDQSDAIMRRRLAGEPAATVMGEAAWQAGLIPEKSSITAADAAGLFQLG